MSEKKRLIDANDALERLKKAEQEMKVISMVGCKAVPMYGVIDFIESRPTVDAVEVVHGRWLNEMHGNSLNGTCSVCGSYDHAYAFGWNYCPNCGARMDGDSQ